jgi:hypothetical protein
MKSNIFIPKQINVGFQERNDTYTKKLAYVIYFDNKGVLRKETSWNSWRDNKIDNIIYDNVPTEGFVLNKKVGDYVSDWNHRQAYVRVYDPRDFEFEITIENLLYILENASSIKGKGLEGLFTYGWNGKDLILMPVDSPDYQEISKFNELVYENKSIKAKDLKIGATYLTKQNEKWIYIGKFNYHGWRSKEKKYFWFFNERGNFEQIITLSSKIIDIIDENCVSNYADIFDKMESDYHYSPYDNIKDEYIAYTLEEFKEKVESDSNWLYFYDNSHEKIELRKRNNVLQIGRKVVKQSNSYWNNHSYTETEYTDLQYSSFEEVYALVLPHYKNEYLENGKFFRRDR